MTAHASISWLIHRRPAVLGARVELYSSHFPRSRAPFFVVGATTMEPLPMEPLHLSAACLTAARLLEEPPMSIPIQVGLGGNVKVVRVVPGRTTFVDVQTALLVGGQPHVSVVLASAPQATAAAAAVTSVAELLHHHHQGTPITATYVTEEKRLGDDYELYTLDEFLAWYGDERGMEKWEDAFPRSDEYRRRECTARFARSFLNRCEAALEDTVRSRSSSVEVAPPTPTAARRVNPWKTPEELLALRGF